MGYADRWYSHSPGDDFRGGSGGGFGGLTGALTPWVKRLLIANTAVWLLNAVDLLPLRWTADTFGFVPGDVLTHPWTPLTYMFVHGGFWHLFVNMLVLFFFGPPLERAWGSREFLKFYLVAGVGGALISVLFLPTPMVSPDTVVVGASGAIYGVMLAFALMWPEAKVYIWGIFPLRAKWFVAILAAVAFLSTSASVFGGGGSQVAHWAHLGGLITGFLYLRFGERLSKALDRVADVLPSGGSEAPSRGRRSRRRSTERRGASGTEIRFRRPGASKTPDGEEPGEDTLDEVDRILDKIREKGLESLTADEREFLDEMSRRYRG